MQVGVVEESFPGERRVALVRGEVAKMGEGRMHGRVEPGAGVTAGFPDELYAEKGAKVACGRAEALSAEILVQVRALGANLQTGRADLPSLRADQIVIGQCDPLGEPRAI